MEIAKHLLSAENVPEVGQKLNIDGRVMNVRVAKQSCFVDLLNNGQTIQLHLSADQMQRSQEIIGLSNLINVEGNIQLTKTGQRTIFVERVELISKSRNPVTRKQCILESTDKRFKNRVPDIVQHKCVRDFLTIASMVKSNLRRVLCNDGFLEFDTGILQQNFEAGLAKPFETQSKALNTPLYLRLTAEVRLKMLIAAGFKRVFEMGPSFRNEGLNAIYNPEFTLLEAYGADLPVEELKKMFRKWIQLVVNDVFGKFKIDNEERTIDFSGDWQSIPYFEMVSRINEREISSDTSIPELVRIFKRFGEDQYSEDMPASTLLLKYFNHVVAPKLSNPTFVTSLPAAACSPFVATNKDDENVSQSSWLVVDGLVIGDFYQDENNPAIVESRLQKQSSDNNKEMNVETVSSLSYGLPRTSGMGIGINRLLLTLRPNGITKDIKETIVFPTK